DLALAQVRLDGGGAVGADARRPEGVVDVDRLEGHGRQPLGRLRFRGGGEPGGEAEGGGDRARPGGAPRREGTAVGVAESGPAVKGHTTRTRRPSTRSRPSAKRRMASGYASHSCSKTRAASVSGVSSSRTGHVRCSTMGPWSYSLSAKWT